MEHGPIELANIVLIVIGIVLMISGPVIFYRTINGVIQRKKEDPKVSIQPFNNGFNLVIGFAFFVAGILFVINNLRGNSLHL